MAELISRERARHEFALFFQDSKSLVDDCDSLLCMLPTIDAVPVVHGRWMEVPYVYIGLKRYECSNCYSDVFWNDRIQHHKDKCCPNCGARMDGE